MNDTTMVISVKEVAELLQVKPDTIYSWVHYKQIPDNLYRKLGRRPRFIRDEVIKWFLDGAKVTKRQTKN